MQADPTEMADLIAKRLVESAQDSKTQWTHGPRNGIATRHFVVDDLLPTPLAMQIAERFPSAETMRLMHTFREFKCTTKDIAHCDPIVAAAIFAFQAPAVVKVVEQITGLTGQEPDPKLYAGGLSSMTKGHFLRPHLDNSHDDSLKRYRCLNLLYYVSPDWTSENGGNLELWSPGVQERIEVTSRFNRLVVMETHKLSWHGVNTVVADSPRQCVSNYYFSEQSPIGEPFFQVTSFLVPPQAPVLRQIMRLDNALRMMVRGIKRQGFSRRDLNQVDANRPRR